MAKTHDGKPGISVRQHLLTAAFTAEAQPARFPRFRSINRIDAEAVPFPAAIPDVGKIETKQRKQAKKLHKKSEHTHTPLRKPQ